MQLRTGPACSISILAGTAAGRSGLNEPSWASRNNTPSEPQLIVTRCSFASPPPPPVSHAMPCGKNFCGSYSNRTGPGSMVTWPSSARVTRTGFGTAARRMLWSEPQDERFRFPGIQVDLEIQQQPANRSVGPARQRLGLQRQFAVCRIEQRRPLIVPQRPCASGIPDVTGHCCRCTPAGS